jgi:hypothetical protein
MDDDRDVAGRLRPTGGRNAGAQPARGRHRPTDQDSNAL